MNRTIRIAGSGVDDDVALPAHVIKDLVFTLEKHVIIANGEEDSVYSSGFMVRR